MYYGETCSPATGGLTCDSSLGLSCQSSLCGCSSSSTFFNGTSCRKKNFTKLNTPVSYANLITCFRFIETYMTNGLSCDNVAFSTGCNASLNLVCDSSTQQCM